MVDHVCMLTTHDTEEGQAGPHRVLERAKLDRTGYWRGPSRTAQGTGEGQAGLHRVLERAKLDYAWYWQGSRHPRQYSLGSGICAVFTTHPGPAPDPGRNPGYSPNITCIHKKSNPSPTAQPEFTDLPSFLRKHPSLEPNTEKLKIWFSKGVGLKTQSGLGLGLGLGLGFGLGIVLGLGVALQT